MKKTLRKPYVMPLRLDLLSQDRLDWALICTKQLYPEAKLNKSLLLRRALGHYISWLENITTSASGGRSNRTAIEAEGYQILSYKNDQSGLGDTFPEDQLFDKSGKLVPFRILQQAARDAARAAAKGKVMKEILGDSDE
jgi:hypothetical protein